MRRCLESKGFALLAATHDLYAPLLLWPEALSVLHELRSRDAGWAKTYDAEST